MQIVHLYAAVTAVLMLNGYYWLGKKGGVRAKNNDAAKRAALILFSAAFLVRIISSIMSEGHEVDTNCFLLWSERIAQTGPAGFYSADAFTDYPPGYMYVLWLVGMIKKFTRIGTGSGMHLLIMRLPAMICDMACGWLILREARKKFSESGAITLCSLWLFNPFVVLNSSIWGQVDSVFTLAVVLMCLYLVQGRMWPAYIAFGIGVLIKPQSLMFGPILLIGVIDWVFLKGFTAKKFMTNLLQGLSVIAGMAFICMPFGISNVLAQYFDTVGSYPYASVNAFNIWGLFGKNWVSQDEMFLGIPYHMYGMAGIVFAMALVLYLGFKKEKSEKKYPFLAALLIITIFMLSVRMHERYMYPGMILLLLAYIYRPSKHAYLSFGLLSLAHCYNTAYVMFVHDPNNYANQTTAIFWMSLGMCICVGSFYYTVWLRYYGNEKKDIKKSVQKKLPEKKSHIRRSEEKMKIGRMDMAIMAAVTLVYGGIALYDLGDMQAPVTHYDMEHGQAIELDFGDKSPSTIAYYIAPWHDRTFQLELYMDGKWEEQGPVELSNVFTWQEMSMLDGASAIRMTLDDTQASLIEFVCKDKDGNIIMPLNAGDYPELFDEAGPYPGQRTFRNSMYFDEVYHGRTAYEFLEGLHSYETTHPPLGKIFIAIGIAIFGMNPFGWRIAGTLFGIAMVPLIYLFAKRVTKNVVASSLVCVMFAFDFMHFTQTRIATIDVYVTFFIILMYYFMYQYSRMSFYDTPLKKTFVPLAACGVSMGLGIASKWTGIYAGAGLAVIFFSVMWRRYGEYKYAAKSPSSNTEGIQHKDIMGMFLPNLKKTVSFCMIVFVAVPALIYLLSYIPFRDYNDTGLIQRALSNQTDMFSYHSELEATHLYASSWNEWPIIKMPVWYYSNMIDENLREGISAFGNPAVWWMGIPAAFYMAWLWIRKKDRTAGFLTVGYLAQYLPWFFVSRITFIYHYFPSVPFIVLMCGYGLMQTSLAKDRKKLATAAVVYGAIVVMLFALFYPVLSGQPVDKSYVDIYLRWSEDWTLTAK